jgi:hypothetical protein
VDDVLPRGDALDEQGYWAGYMGREWAVKAETANHYKEGGRTMMGRNFRWATLVFAGVLLAGSILVGGNSAIAQKGGVLDQKPIGSVGVFEINDLTGPTSDSCVPHHNGIWDVIRATNEEGGIVYKDPKTGKQERATIEFQWGDNKAQAGPVPTLYERLSTGTPKPVICYMGSSAAAETTPPWTQRDHIVQISGPSGQPTWDPPRWSFTITPDYPADACTAAWWAMQDWKRKGRTEAPGWAWFTLDLPYGRAPIKPESEAYVKQLGFKIVGTWTMPFTPVDTGPQFRSMIDAGANYCYGNLVVLQQQKLMKDVTKLGLKEKIQVVACPYGIMEDIVKVAGDDADGLVGVHYAAFPEDLDKPGVKWASDISKKYGHPYTTDAILGCAIGRLMITAVKRALEAKGYPISGDDVYNAMLSPQGFDFDGLLPTMKFTAEERRGVWVTHMRGVKNGRIVRVSEDFKVPDMKPGGQWTPKQ